MNNRKNEKTFKTNLQRYFRRVINLGLIGQKTTLWKMDIPILVGFLLTSNFVKQKILERTLYDLRVIDRGRRISIKNFDGQLERDSQVSPYWNIYLQTTALITSRCIARAISKELFKTKNSVDLIIHIIPESDFYPDYFSWAILKFEELLRNENVKEAIQERPGKYQGLIENRDEIKNK